MLSSFKRYFSFWLLCVLFNYLGAFAQSPNHAEHYPILFDVEELTPHTDDNLIRISGNLKSKPNTSANILSIELRQSQSIYAVDTDGFDLGRYFQWEEDGNIKIEIDFPCVKPKEIAMNFKPSQLIFYLKDGRDVTVNDIRK